MTKATQCFLNIQHVYNEQNQTKIWGYIKNTL